jgi:4-hydroxy-3-polyprenylbenzoate decarboxylase
MDRRVRLERFELKDLLGDVSSSLLLLRRAEGRKEADGGSSSPRRGEVRYYHYMDFRAGIASGSFLTAGMVVCPCSMGTLAGIAHGLSQNLIHRAADVHLKERRSLVLVPRETPLNVVQLKNMTACVEAGAVILPAMPAFYTRPQTLSDVIDFIVGRVCDQLGVEHNLLRRWGSP